ncbi:MAG TPA: AMP-binding protein [Rubrivivax sp.]|nr:AMP-binding protein [Rubrivivax sp.]
MIDFVSVLDQHARTRGDRLALRADGRDWSYAELAETTRRAAAVLQACGVGSGDRVALFNFNTPGFVFALFGVWRLQAAVVPVNHKLQAPEVEYVLQHSGAKVCLADAALAPVARRVGGRVRWLVTAGEAEGIESFDALLARAAAHDAGGAVPAGDTPAEVLYTSGTTGRPKGCLHSHANLFHTAICCAAAVSLTPADRNLTAMPIWHSSPLNNWFLGTLLMGGANVLMREYAPQAFIETLARDRITFTFGAPIAFLAPLQAVPDLQRHDLSAMRLWTCGGGPLSAENTRRLAAGYKTDRIMQVYGMTESGPMGTVLYPEEAIAKAGSIGRCGTAGVLLELRREDGSPCGAGEVGEIHLRSAAMMQGYLDDPGATAQAFTPDGWYRSGDMARIDADGYMFIADRAKDMIVTGGENVYSKEVEDALSVHADVLEAAVIGRPHPDWGETVMAIVVARPGSGLDEAGLKAFLEPRLARYKVPRIYEFRDALPHTPSGKVQKHLLRQ